MLTYVSEYNVSWLFEHAVIMHFVEVGIRLILHGNVYKNKHLVIRNLQNLKLLLEKF